MAKTVAILGGGTAGLSAAHELIERGFDVDVYEKAGDVGGKARSNTKPGTGKNPRADLPGEHGFRFFPGFYRHLSDTMKRIPLPGGKTAFDNLVQAPRETVATKDHSLLVTPARFPQSWDDLKAAFKVLTEAGKFGISPDEVAWFV